MQGKRNEPLSMQGSAGDGDAKREEEKIEGKEKRQAKSHGISSRARPVVGRSTPSDSPKQLNDPYLLHSACAYPD